MRPTHPRSSLAPAAVALVVSYATGFATADEQEEPRDIDYVFYAPAPRAQSVAAAEEKSAGCVSCHERTDAASMHASPAVVLGCTDCHGGDASARRNGGAEPGSADYAATRERAHVPPRYPNSWHHPSSANPVRSYTLLNRESPEFVRFVNPGDYRVAAQACGACHQPIIDAATRSLMATGAMLWGGAAYNNGILPFKNYVLGEGYTPDGEAAIVTGAPATDLERARGALNELYPLPPWEGLRPGDIFRVFEGGGRNLTNLFAETGLPNAQGALQRLEEPGRPDNRQSNRGAGTGARIAVPVLNIHKTRLNDPLTWFLGTNDQPGDYRSSGCSACHVVYANDRDPKHSGPYAAAGHTGVSRSVDPTIPRDEPGHPLEHTFTRAIPTSQCMVCHMHQPNMFLNSYLGYTMWDYEADAPAMWPAAERNLDSERQRAILDRNPEGAAVRGLWGDLEFLTRVSDLNPTLKDTQFADYHGHGWNFRAVFKRDRAGRLLDAADAVVADDDPEKFAKAVHLSSIHADRGMHCVDCHFAQDAHGDGHLYGEVAKAIEIECRDCHGTVSAYPDLKTSGPAAPSGGTNLAAIRNADGRRRFEWLDGKLIQRSAVEPEREWTVSLVKDTVTPGHAEYNAEAARAKLMSRDVATLRWGGDVAPGERAHADDKMECYSCHTSWITSCAGCHLPIEANWMTERHHFEGGMTRNYATYNPQVARDEMFMLGLRGPSDGGKIAPVRSSSALVLSSTNANRERIYVQQPPIAASGFSSQAFNPHFPHTERREETKTCSDCHLAAANDNNAIMAQLLLLGTNFVNFVGFHAWVGTETAVTGVQVTEWDEPQAVIGSYLHRYAYPDRYAAHRDANRVLGTAHAHESGAANCLQLRGEYLYVAERGRGLAVYDVANVGNKGFSQRIVAAPFAALGHDTSVATADATCVALPTNQPIAPLRNAGELMREANQEQPFHPIYHYALVTDAVEGLVLVDVDTLADGDLGNNYLERSLTFNPDGVLAGARHLTIAGHYVYVAADAGIVVVDMSSPLEPAVAAVVPVAGARASALQFRYLFVTADAGLVVVDVTQPAAPRLVGGALVPLADAQRVYVARTYAYVAAGSQGLAIVAVERPEAPRLVALYDADGQLGDARDVVLGSTNASLFAYVADGRGGLKVLQLTSPETQPNFYGFSPAPRPELIASFATPSPALALSKGLDRDRAVDETGHQIAVFGRLGSRPLDRTEMQRLYLDDAGRPWYVED
jgi:hypothetical protein